ncbi:LysR family transcriptional regulator [Amycolatopsis sp. K13G38]|uniref:LysR family transcriptional regulator n=1 Tax=Amycolatopsis acididurans TaxID=2724524 RepID=A0ABX1JFS6_9PSEU|nr:LysR substrate-binding domain-containing protein [Amycolatopsis acididurans]NKQ57699.1 LysR family transcriptional regulator [Amycolatopsis acididurans]
MDVRYLRYFVVVAEELHFGRAAHRLHMAQPPLSQRIRDLERDLGVRLFDRNTRQVRLTEAGALLLEHARRVLDDVDAARQAMGRIKAGGATALRVGCLPDTMPATIQAIMDEFHAHRPDVLVELRELTTNEQLRALRSGELDIGVLRHPCDTVGLDCGVAFQRPFGVILRKDHALGSRRQIRLRDLNGSSLVIFPRKMASQLYDHMLSVCRDRGFMPGTFRHARNPYFIYGLVLAGMGVHLNERPTYRLQAGLVWRPLVDEPLSWVTSAAWVPSRRDETIEAFAAAILAGFTSTGHQLVTAAS